MITLVKFVAIHPSKFPTRITASPLWVGGMDSSAPLKVPILTSTPPAIIWKSRPTMPHEQISSLLVGGKLSRVQPARCIRFRTRSQPPLVPLSCIRYASRLFAGTKNFRSSRTPGIHPVSSTVPPNVAPVDSLCRVTDVRLKQLLNAS